MNYQIKMGTKKMNLRQLEEMVNVLKSKGFPPETKIMIDVDGTGHYMKNIHNIVSSLPCDKSEQYIAMNAQYRPYPNNRAFNMNFVEPSINFPNDFPPHGK